MIMEGLSGSLHTACYWRFSLDAFACITVNEVDGDFKVTHIWIHVVNHTFAPVILAKLMHTAHGELVTLNGLHTSKEGVPP